MKNLHHQFCLLSLFLQREQLVSIVLCNKKNTTKYAQLTTISKYFQSNSAGILFAAEKFRFIEL